MRHSLMFRVLPALETLDENDPFTHLLPEEFIVPSNAGVALGTTFRRWLNAESISYCVRRTNDDKPTITFDDERGALMYEAMRNPLLLEVPRKLLRPSSIRGDDDTLGGPAKVYFNKEVTEWLTGQNLAIELTPVPERAGGWFIGSVKKIFARFGSERDFIVFKLKWL